jgi:hypothetical protein
VSHPDPRFCVCGHHEDGHAEKCYGAECQCFEFSPLGPVLAAKQRALFFVRKLGNLEAVVDMKKN